MIEHLIYAAAWLSFAVGHSVLTMPVGRRGLLAFAGRWERLVYNALSVAHLGAVFGIGVWVLGDEAAFDRPLFALIPMVALQVAGLITLLAAMRRYDGRRFLGFDAFGLRPARAAALEPEPLQTGGLNAYVRHPLYFAGLLLLWGSAGSPLSLATAIWATLYLYIGARFEERKLSQLYGAAYDAYRASVPMMVPWRGRAWPEKPAAE